MKKVFLTATAVLALSTTAGAWDTILGQNCAVSRPQMVAVHDSRGLAELWAKTYQGTPQALDLPSVDFTKETVIAVFLGEKPTPGYKVDLVLQQDPMDPSRLFVLYKEIAPKQTALIPQMVTRPFVIRKIDKAYVQVVFEFNRAMKSLPVVFTKEARAKLTAIVSKLQKIAESDGKSF
ncbi:MAG: protease complex subunit PrcB family protein [Elusimicrobia bacterium]|nr:protease complex subunit PrcB family protein [Elusimicrobiota bacterium]